MDHEVPTKVAPVEHPAPRRGSAPPLRFVLLTLVTTLAVLFAGRFVMKRLAAQKAPAQRKAVPAKVRVVDVITTVRGPHTTGIGGNASAAAAQRLEIVGEVTGRVIAAHPSFRPGGFIAKGEVLFEVDRSNLENEQARLEAELERTRARQRALGVQRAGAKQTVADNRRAVALTRRQLERDEGLAEQGHLSTAATDRTRLDLSGRLERLHNADTQSRSLPHQQSQARAELTIVEQRLARIALDLARTTVKAEFDLQVRTGGLEESAWVTAGRSVAAVDDISGVELPLSLPVEDAVWLTRDSDQAPTDRRGWARLLADRKAIVTRTGSDGRTRRWEGTVHRIGPGLNDQTRMLSVFIRVTETVASGSPPLPLLPGMFCHVAIAGRTLQDVVVIPRKALQEDNRVFIATPDDLLQSREVVVERISGDRAIIRNGLDAGERVILTALPQAVEGTSLKVRTQADASGAMAQSPTPPSSAPPK